jgi:3-hydroxy-9,10-secoandrosta-1,3,5(10)-triene-9,17-dione monooxygenase reductase component
VEPGEFRRLMGCWATGVSVITANGSAGPAGATANALTSLSLHPPLALACFDLASRTLRAVRESERFCVNVLAATQRDVAATFATKASQEEKFAAIEHEEQHGAPVIRGCLAWMVCALDSELRRGDHVIVIGSVVAGCYDDDAAPLTFHRGVYGSLQPEAHAHVG